MTIAEIKRIMTEAFISDPEVKAKYGLEEGKSFEEQFSAASLESILFDDMAAATHLSFQQFNQLKIDVLEELKRWRPRRPNWYAEKSKLFQYGSDLFGDTDQYDNTGLSVAQIEAMRMIKFAAAEEAQDRSVLLLKVATGSAENRSPLSAAQYASFSNYISRISDAGVFVEIINNPADALKLEIDLYYDPLILGSAGERLDGESATPIQDAINGYVNSLEFNGTYISMSLIDTIQKVEGAKIVEIKFAAYRFGSISEWRPINSFQVPYSGYYKISPNDLKINFIPYE
ncbi:conserved hypothetical protein [uncultured Dysgonomonas sp.]|uniref:Baseplate protein J-like domain-containing protein n=1 Tax=uncultured Dysgonomonas sp. TaxID=206096 RepID=A0A212J790_9BACT|nr:hypothetical protein [uncultured Dysgonomonas sp.]SBV95288.1 conserved hypothetical protein [uncultured Dysgonomonas sp.]